MLYAPDYVINAGGIIDIYYERHDYSWDKVEKHLEGIGDTVTEVFQQAAKGGRPTGEVADMIAESRFTANAL